MLFIGLGRSVMGKTVPEVSSTARGRRQKHIYIKFNYHEMQRTKEFLYFLET